MLSLYEIKRIKSWNAILPRNYCRVTNYLTIFLLQESHYKAKQEVQIIIPDKLKYFLADDWGCIAGRRRVSNGSIYEELYSCGLDLM